VATAVSFKNRVYEFPRLTVKLHLLLMTGDVDQMGYYVLTRHNPATIRFFDVDNLKMEGVDTTTPFLD
jgi:hypothetical protein